MIRTPHILLTLLLAALFPGHDLSAQKTPPSTYTVEGRVIEWLTLKGIEAVTVEAVDSHNHRYSTLTAKDGSYILDHLPSGSKLTLRCYQLGYSPNPVESEVALKSETTKWNVHLFVVSTDRDYLKKVAEKISILKGDENPVDASLVHTSVHLTPGDKKMIADEVQRQVATENLQAQRKAQNQDLASGSSGIARMLSDGRPHIFVVANDLDVVAESGGECAVSAGDVIQIESAPTAGATAAQALVLSSQGGKECVRAAHVTVSLSDLQDMQYHMRKEIEEGMRELMANQKKGGLPPSPSAQSASSAVAPPPNETDAAEIARQAQDADHAEAVVTHAPPQAPNPDQAEATRKKLAAQLNQILQTQETSRGIVVSMADVLFDTNTTTLKPNAKMRLDQVSGILLAYPGLKLQVVGYTDDLGLDESNPKLSEERADAVRDYLVSQGMGHEAVSVVGYGNTMATADNSNTAGRSRNRHLELVVAGPAIGIEGQVPASNQSTPALPSAPQ